MTFTTPLHRRDRVDGRAARPWWRSFAARRYGGTSLVEFGLATPLLLLVMLGTIDLGRMLHDYIQIRAAVVEGASYGARNPTDTGGMVAEVTSSSVPAGTAVSVDVEAACLVKSGTGKVTVSATHTFVPITTQFLEEYWGLGSVNMSASSKMRCLT